MKIIKTAEYKKIAQFFDDPGDNFGDVEYLEDGDRYTSDLDRFSDQQAWEDAQADMMDMADDGFADEQHIDEIDTGDGQFDDAMVSDEELLGMDEEAIEEPEW